MDRQKLIEDLKRDEGVKLKVYPDSKGILTIGVGRNLQDNGITLSEAYSLLNNDVDEVLDSLDENLPWWRDLAEVRQRVLANMAFNMGVSPHAPPGKRGLLDFTKTLGYLKVGDYERAAVEMLDSPWAKQVGPRAIRLSDMMRKGA